VALERASDDGLPGQVPPVPFFVLGHPLVFVRIHAGPMVTGESSDMMAIWTGILAAMRARPAWMGEGVFALGVAAVAALAQLATFDRSAVPVDEGQLLAIAARLLDGEVLYRDIYTGIFPGVYWATTALIGLFGEDVVVTRWAQLVLNAATAGCLYWLGRRVMGLGWALLAPALYVALVPFGFPGLTMVNYSSLSLGFALFALIFLLRHLETDRLLDAALCGVFLGFCGMVKQNFGGLAVFAILIGLVWARWGDPQGRRSLWSGVLTLIGGGAAIGLLMIGGLLITGAFTDFVHQTLLVIGDSQLAAFNDPIPPVFGAHPENDSRFVFVYMPSALFNYLVRGETFFGLALSPALQSASIRIVYGGTLALLGAAVVLLRFAGRDEDRLRGRSTRALCVFAIVFFFGIFPSAIWSHLAFVLPPILLIPGLLADRVAAHLDRSRLAVGVWQAAHVVVALLALLVLVRVSLDLRRWYSEPLGISRGSLYVDEGQKALLRGGTRFLVRCAQPDEPVFVAPDMPLLYFLADRRNPTPFDLVIPGDVKGDVIVQRLEESQTRCVVYNPKMYLQFAPFDELFPEVARLFDESYRRAAVIRGQGTEWYGLERHRKPRS